MLRTLAHRIETLAHRVDRQVNRAEFDGATGYLTTRFTVHACTPGVDDEQHVGITEHCHGLTRRSELSKRGGAVYANKRHLVVRVRLRARVGGHLLTQLELVTR